MAFEGVKSKNILLSVNMGTEAVPDWLLIGCSTADGYSSSRDAVAIGTKCSGSFTEQLPGDFTWSFSNTSYVNKNAEVKFATLDQIFELSKEDVNKQWKLESIDPDYDFLRLGYGFISDFSNTSDQGDYLQFDLTVTGSGEPTNVQST